MKNFILLLIVLVFASTGFSASLISDPHPDCGSPGQRECPVACEVFANGISLVDNYPLEPDMSIKYDLGSMPTGETTYTAKFIDQYGRKSALSPVPLLLLGVSNTPSGLRLTP
jgi:hypothetical protein